MAAAPDEARAGRASLAACAAILAVAACGGATDAPPAGAMTVRLAGAIAPDTLRGVPTVQLLCGSSGTYNILPAVTSGDVGARVGFRDPRAVDGPAEGDTVPLVDAFVGLRIGTAQEATYRSGTEPGRAAGTAVVTHVSSERFAATFHARVWPETGTSDTASVTVEGEVSAPLPHSCSLGGTPP